MVDLQGLLGLSIQTNNVETIIFGGATHIFVFDLIGGRLLKEVSVNILKNIFILIVLRFQYLLEQFALN
jgi:hypothetical protein